jgi:hypothetical protein
MDAVRMGRAIGAALVARRSPSLRKTVAEFFA